MKTLSGVLLSGALIILAGCATAQPRPVPSDLTVMPADFVAIAEVDPTILQEIRYYGSHNFLGRRVRGYKAPKCILTRKTAEALKAVQAELKGHSLTLKVYDCYRPQRAVDDFVAWAKDLKDTKTKKEFYPGEDKSNLFKDGYIDYKSGHSRGSSLDLTLVPLPVPAQPKYKPGSELVECYKPRSERFADNMVDMGTGYDCFDQLAHSENPDIGSVQRRNRLLLRVMMEKHGFKYRKEEWWHYTLIDEPYPDTYFNFKVR